MGMPKTVKKTEKEDIENKIEKINLQKNISKYGSLPYQNKNQKNRYQQCGSRAYLFLEYMHIQIAIGI